MILTRNEALERGRCKGCCAHSEGRWSICTAMPLGGKYCPRAEIGKVDFGEAVAPKSGAQRAGPRGAITPKVEGKQCSLKLE